MQGHQKEQPVVTEALAKTYIGDGMVFRDKLKRIAQKLYGVMRNVRIYIYKNTRVPRKRQQLKHL